MGYYEGKTVVITGASEGLGRVIVTSFAAKGAKLILVDMKEPVETVRMLRESGGKLLGTVLCDISRESSVRKMGEQVHAFSGGCVDVLVNNAGYNGKASLVENMKLEDWQYTLSVNLTGTMMVCREMIPLMNTQGAAILNVSSNVARRGLPYRSDYVCSKWALMGLTQTLALELVKKGIRVNAVCPGPINGDRIEQLLRMHAEAEGMTYEAMFESWKNAPMGRFVEADEVAQVILFLCSDKASAMTGQSLNVTGGQLMN